MIAFPGMLVDAAERAGITTPNDPDNFDPEQYPHFHIFCNVQLGASMPSMDAHWRNAEVIAAIPSDQLKTITMNELIDRGLSISFR